MKAAVLLFAIEFVNFLVVTLNFRALAKNWRGFVVVTDAVIAMLGFTIIKQVGEADTLLAQAGFVLGAALGSYVGMTISRRWTDAI